MLFRHTVWHTKAHSCPAPELWQLQPSAGNFKLLELCVQGDSGNTVKYNNIPLWYFHLWRSTRLWLVCIVKATIETFCTEHICCKRNKCENSKWGTVPGQQSFPKWSYFYYFLDRSLEKHGLSRFNQSAATTRGLENQTCAFISPALFQTQHQAHFEEQSEGKLFFL